MASFAGNAPWLLEDRLRLAGASYVAKPAWTPHVVTDGNLVTGQQSTSAQVTADAVMNLLKVAVWAVGVAPGDREVVADLG
jgi:putative intracellular protease/amidase